MFDLIPYEDMDNILDEFKRVLKKSGKLVLVNITKGETTASKLYDIILQSIAQNHGRMSRSATGREVATARVHGGGEGILPADAFSFWSDFSVQEEVAIVISRIRVLS